MRGQEEEVFSDFRLSRCCCLFFVENFWLADELTDIPIVQMNLHRREENVLDRVVMGKLS